MVKSKTLEGWHKSEYNDINDYLKVGDIVDIEMYNYFLNILPPQAHQNSLLQVGGTACEHQENEDGKLMPTYMTFTKMSEGNWKYEVECFNREWINRNPVLEITRYISKERMDELVNSMVTLIKNTFDKDESTTIIESCGIRVNQNCSDITPTKTAQLLLNFTNKILETSYDLEEGFSTLVNDTKITYEELRSCGYSKKIDEIEIEREKWWDNEVANDPLELEQQENEEPDIDDSFDI